jgi:predicted nucleic acid-binding protein
VPETWIIDASPLIILARIARLDWFERLPSAVQVPQAVIREIAAGAGHDPSAPGAVRWATSRAVADLPVPTSIARRGLGDGEAQVITHGQTPELSITIQKFPPINIQFFPLVMAGQES